jgi:hypothetical protein
MTKTTTLALALGLAAVAAPTAAQRHTSDEDLAVVKKATSSPSGPRTVTEAPPRADEPQWLRVRIVERGDEKATVKVNLPLALVRALADDVPVPGCGGRGGDGGERLTVGQVLRALDTGESLVEIEDAESTVRVWVE